MNATRLGSALGETGELPRMQRRCGWARDPLDIQHHDEEWGVPEYDDHRLLEFLILEGAQAGLSWLTILRKRDAYRKAFAAFDPETVADISRALSRDLVKRGFRFVGPIICYAFMQSVGMVNDHVVDCFRWAAVRRAPSMVALERSKMVR